ncbi:MAG TPA: AAA family ATPase [Myxococcota bacterium]|nr:AAA family ATPase [Myxococcota bacterium]HSA23454.1 AAA family ATPase [Myxococcota bacterium]
MKDPGQSFFLFGPRGTGKSTWMKENLRGSLWIDLLLPETFRSLSARPERLRELVAGRTGPLVVVIDEVQRVPQLLPQVHALLEEDRRLRFVLTGSSARKLRRTGVDLLGGRALLRSLHPFLACELGASFDLGRALEIGLVPLVTQSAAPADTLAAYASLYVQEEVQAEGLTRNVGAFHRFLEAVSLSHAGLLNVSSVARDCEVNRKVVESYLEILEDLLLCFSLPVFARRPGRATVARRKFFLFDAGLFRALRPRGMLEAGMDLAGPALEGIVAQHLRAVSAYRNDDSQLSFWRTRGGVEVDLVWYGPRVFQAIEVKNASRVRPEDLRGLRAFHGEYPEAELLLLYRGTERLRLGEVQCLPCEEYLRELVP